MIRDIKMKEQIVLDKEEYEMYLEAVKHVSQAVVLVVVFNENTQRQTILFGPSASNQIKALIEMKDEEIKSLKAHIDMIKKKSLFKRIINSI